MVSISLYQPHLFVVRCVSFKKAVELLNILMNRSLIRDQFRTLVVSYVVIVYVIKLSASIIFLCFSDQQQNEERIIYDTPEKIEFSFPFI